MRHLADSVLDYLMYLNFSDEDAYDREHTLKLLEELTGKIENSYSENEKLALSDAAARRLELYARESDSTEELGISFLTEEQQQFLESVAAGWFDGVGEEESV